MKLAHEIATSQGTKLTVVLPSNMLSAFNVALFSKLKKPFGDVTPEDLSMDLPHGFQLQVFSDSMVEVSNKILTPTVEVSNGPSTQS